MRRTRDYRRGLSAAVVTTSLWAVAAVGADDPKPPADGNVIQAVQQPPPTVHPPSGTGTQPPPTVPPPIGPQAGDAGGPNPLYGGSAAAVRRRACPRPPISARTLPAAPK